MESNPERYDEWFAEEHGVGMFELESDVDEVVQDDPFDDPYED